VRLLSVALGVLTLLALGSAVPAAAVDAPIGHLGDTLWVQTNGTVGGRVFWDCYRDLVSTVVLINPHTGEHLAQWNL
jgi:hypothetical protein